MRSFILLGLCLAALAGQAQTSTPAIEPGPASKNWHLIRSGIASARSGNHTEYYVIGKSFALIPPTYVGMLRYLYVEAPFPVIRYSKSSFGPNNAFDWTPTVGYVFTKSDRAFRPFVGLEFGYQAYHSTEIFPPLPDSSGQYSSPYLSVQEIKGSLFTVNLRFGGYYRLSNRMVLDLTLTSPTGHSLFAAGSSTIMRFTQPYSTYNQSYSTAFSKGFLNSYGTWLPRIELGFSVKICAGGL